MESVVKKMHYNIQVYEILRNNILNGTLQPSEKINENKIATTLGVSRSPVREALRMLEQDELIILSENGLIVNPMDDKTMREIYECRIALEPYAAGLAAENIKKKHITTLRKYIEQNKRYHKKDEYDKIMANNTAFHDLIVELCGNDHLAKMIQKNADLFSLSRTKEFACYKRTEKVYLVEHEEIVNALETNDRNLVETVMRKHLENDFKYYLERQEGN